MSVAPWFEETVTVPRRVRFPVELVPPDGFDEEHLETWPRVVGRLEFVEGKLLFMPPCGDSQQYTVTDVVITLGGWVRSHREFYLGTNEAGMRLGGSTRAADAAIWRRDDAGRPHGGLHRTPPVLAVEVAGLDDPEPLLLEKGRWYLQVGVAVVWVVLPDRREVIVLTADGGHTRHRRGERLPPHAALPDLTPPVAELFVQLDDAP